MICTAHEAKEKDCILGWILRFHAMDGYSTIKRPSRKFPVSLLVIKPSRNLLYLVTVHLMRPLGSVCGANTSASLPVFLRP